MFHLRHLLACTALACSAAYGGPSIVPDHAAPLIGTIVGIADGDTLTLLDANFTQHKIRLAYIDAPENSQAFGEASKKSLAEMAYSRQAKAYCPSIDRYQRRVCEVVIEGKNVNTTQVERGMAWMHTAYAPKNSPLLIAQEKAKLDKTGLWQDPNPVAPWDFRRKK